MTPVQIYVAIAVYSFVYILSAIAVGIYLYDNLQWREEALFFASAGWLFFLLYLFLIHWPIKFMVWTCQRAARRGKKTAKVVK
jgi:hypothetical protein